MTVVARYAAKPARRDEGKDVVRYVGSDEVGEVERLVASDVSRDVVRAVVRLAP